MYTQNFQVSKLSINKKVSELKLGDGQQSITLTFDQIKNHSTFRKVLYQLESLPIQISWVIRIFGKVVFTVDEYQAPFELTTSQTRTILAEVYASIAV